MIRNTITGRSLEKALLALDQESAEKIIKEALLQESTDHSASNIISEALTRVGTSWEKGQLSLSQVYMTSLICEKIIDKILPPQHAIRKKQPKTAIAVLEDYHLLGKRIVYATLRANGIELLDLGGGLTVDKLISIVKKEEIKILLISVLMLPSALRIKELTERLAETDVTIIVGGAPFRFDYKLCEEVGADYFGKDSGEALQIVKHLMEKAL